MVSIIITLLPGGEPLVLGRKWKYIGGGDKRDKIRRDRTPARCSILFKGFLLKSIMANNILY